MEFKLLRYWLGRLSLAALCHNHSLLPRIQAVTAVLEEDINISTLLLRTSDSDYSINLSLNIEDRKLRQHPPQRPEEGRERPGNPARRSPPRSSGDPGPYLPVTPACPPQRKGEGDSGQHPPQPWSAGPGEPEEPEPPPGRPSPSRGSSKDPAPHTPESHPPPSRAPSPPRGSEPPRSPTTQGSGPTATPEYQARP
ncbi:hypothetical protein SRHO_G00178720 [Serrasalmus rhombeus]